MSIQWCACSLQHIGHNFSSTPSTVLTRDMLSETTCVWVSRISSNRRVLETSLLVFSLSARIWATASSIFAAILQMDKSFIKISLSLELIESLVDEDSEMVGCVVLQEIRNSMEKFLVQGLARGCTVNLREAFDNAWSELVLQEDPIVIDMDTFDNAYC